MIRVTPDILLVTLIIAYLLNILLISSFHVPIPDEIKKLTQIFILKLLCSASKVFVKAFIKPFEEAKRRVKAKT